ncbi:2-phospho-L-lactate guanylyltransferase [Nakamurella sp.]|uniref:2-phospho-L-lactate guanylyltransferase n=1 Tax=Nakamurella sp. TaxID=1869182 RepID=UPI0037847048
MSLPSSRPWTVIVPVKASVRAKSRIRLDPAVRRTLALIMAEDTVSAIVGAAPVGRTLVVLEDPRDGTTLARVPGVDLFVTRTNELNAAIRDGLAALDRDGVGPVAVVPADLPSLTSVELADALTRAAAHPRSVVADRAGTGTTMLAAQSSELLDPRYGADSFLAHVAGGAVPLDLPGRSGLRRDVDRVDNLRSVTGPRTRAILQLLAWPPPVGPEFAGG